jgi:hypothetical protein
VVAATVWGLQEPLDQRVFRSDFSDIQLLGNAVGRGRAAGFAVHAVNGAIFGLVFDELRERVPVSPRKLAVAAALAEHLALYPLFYFIERPLVKSPRVFAQETWRHLLFGWALGRLA